MFRTPEKDVHLHIFACQDAAVVDYLVFRNWLRTNPVDRGLYEETKRKLAEQKWRDMNYYAEAKTEVIGQILARARTSGRTAS